jgi:hypothetical protein
VAGWGLNPGIDLSFYTQPVPSQQLQTDGTASGRIFVPPNVEDELKYQHFMRFDSFQPQADWSELRLVRLPNLNMLEGLPSANNFDPMVPGRYARWMEALGVTLDYTLGLNLMAVTVKILEQRVKVRLP